MGILSSVRNWFGKHVFNVDPIPKWTPVMEGGVHYRVKTNDLLKVDKVIGSDQAVHPERFETFVKAKFTGDNADFAISTAREAYEDSPTFRGVFNRYMKQAGTKIIRFHDSDDTGEMVGGTGIVGRFMTKDIWSPRKKDAVHLEIVRAGQVFDTPNGATPARALLHELIHGVTNLDDAGVAQSEALVKARGNKKVVPTVELLATMDEVLDNPGPTVHLENMIANELGWPGIRTTYVARVNLPGESPSGLKAMFYELETGRRYVDDGTDF